MLSLSVRIPWMTVGLVESVAVVTLNLCTIIVFIRNRNLRKRNTYLVINLAAVDILVGGIAVYDLFYRPGIYCNLWKLHSFEVGTFIFILVLTAFFLFGSLTNITIIALERLHATFRPLKHRVLKKWVYRLIIAVVWVTSGLVSIAFVLLLYFKKTVYYTLSLYFAYISICLVIICVSYTSIVIKVRCGAQPQHHGAASRERKLTMTLLIVTVVSLLLYLPYVVTMLTIVVSKSDILRSLSPPVQFHLYYAWLVLCYANSLVNPILYAIRMPEYRSAFLALFRKRPQQQRQVECYLFATCYTLKNYSKFRKCNMYFTRLYCFETLH